MALPYEWLTLSEAILALRGRLSNNIFWTDAECQIAIVEALRFWNALTGWYKADFVFTSPAPLTWVNIGTLAGSPRFRTVTDAQIYTSIQYSLLEPPTGAGAWTGTAQFNLPSLQYSLQHRIQEIIQASSCNLSVVPIAASPGIKRYALPDTTLEPRRIRYFGLAATTFGTATSGSYSLTVLFSNGIAVGQLVQGVGIQASTYAESISGNVVTLNQPTTTVLTNATVTFLQPITLTREDTYAFDYFETDHDTVSQIPQSWSVFPEPPLSFDLDALPSVPGAFDAIVLDSGPTFDPPNATLLGIPDDFSWLAKYGALADLLGGESEKSDNPRAEYALKRFTEGIKLMQSANWLLQAQFNGTPCDTPSLAEHDFYSPEWQTNPSAWPATVIAGMDFLGVCPASAGSVSVTLVGNIPVPIAPGDFVQCSRDTFSVILGYAQHVCAFKEGGQEFLSTQGLYEDFIRAAALTNKRLKKLGIFSDILDVQGERELLTVPR